MDERQGSAKESAENTRVDQCSTREAAMGKVINCECGQVVRAETDDELVERVEQHVESDHPELRGVMSRDDILAMAEEQ